jgi:hypothetical protein
MAGAHRRLRRGLRAALAVAACALLSACASGPRSVVSPPSAPAAALGAVDPAYDWHALLVAPFGSILKDMPSGLHEVLQFQDEARAKAGAEGPDKDQDKDQECYGGNAPAPNFGGRKLEQFLLCFRHDRLVRIEATLRLPAAQAAALLSRTCAAWDGRCEGRAGDVSFSARLGEDSGEPQLPMLITLRAAGSRP